LLLQLLPLLLPLLFAPLFPLLSALVVGMRTRGRRPRRRLPLWTGPRSDHLAPERV